MMNVLRTLRNSEPVRLYVYPILAVLIGILVARGVIDAEAADLITGAVALILGVGATEAARAKVTPAGRVTDAVTAVVAEVKRAQVSPEVQAILDRARQTVTDTIGRHRSTQ
ncbi:hypothetical protein [Rhodococcus jostii]|uniref:hypothetical protein n=1 Tax=Rhodococcus jostii TaxID=132919 RepID=UPI00363CEBE5